MEVAQYNQYDLYKKANLLWSNGTFLDERIGYGKCKICIYSFDSFYVEIMYDMKINKIKAIKGLDGEADWEGYLKSMRWEDLIG